jgi:ribosomal protein RSM22 (predicted rRNA methylase)
MCVPTGVDYSGAEVGEIKRQVIGKATYGKEVYRVARKARWGGLFPDLDMGDDEDEEEVVDEGEKEEKDAM